MISGYETRDDFLKAISQHIREPELSPELRGALLDGVAAAEEILALSSPDDTASGLTLRLGKWFVRSDDLPFFESLGLMGSMIAALLATGTLAPAAAVSAAAALAGAGWRVWRKGGRLTNEQVAILTLLGGHVSLEEVQLQESLTQHHHKNQVTDVRRILDQLANIELYDGTVASLVRQDVAGRWRVVGI